MSSFDPSTLPPTEQNRDSGGIKSGGTKIRVLGASSLGAPKSILGRDSKSHRQDRSEGVQRYRLGARNFSEFEANRADFLYTVGMGTK